MRKMPVPADQSVRSPAVAGMFYPADPAACAGAARQFVQAGSVAMVRQPLKLESAAPGAIVPHAGWICSGAIAGESIAALAMQRPAAELVVVFGAIHTPLPVDRAVLDSHARWAVPGGQSVVAAIREELSARINQFVTDDRFHRAEHAVEVELPLIQAAWPTAMILPVEVPPNQDALAIGQSVAAIVQASGLSEVYLASSDLTHYGPNYRFFPAGVGEMGIRWAMENDRRLLQIVTDMTPQRIVPEVAARLNACGGGAIAAMMAACMARGAKRAVVLRHQNSIETLAAVAPQRPDNAVGYAAVWVG